MSQIDRACPDFIGGGKDKASCSALISQHSNIREEENPRNQLPKKQLKVFYFLHFFN